MTPEEEIRKQLLAPPTFNDPEEIIKVRKAVAERATDLDDEFRMLETLGIMCASEA